MIQTKNRFSVLSLSMLLAGALAFFTGCEKEEVAIDTVAAEATANVSTMSTLTGYYRGSDQGHYYIRQIGNKVYWFGEDPAGRYANVFWGTVSGNRLTGSFWDVPKGRNGTSGPVNFVVSADKRVITRSGSSNFGGRTLTRSTRPASLPGNRAPGFATRDNINNLTARWSASDRGLYYIRQMGNQVVWFGEQSYTSGRPVWANVAIGTRSGNTISLTWVDVPKGNNGGTGRLTLRVDNANRLTRVSATGGFGGGTFTR